MNVLPQNKYGEILEQLSRIPFNTLFARSVLELKANGLVWADTRIILKLYLSPIRMACRFFSVILKVKVLTPASGIIC